MWWSGEDGDDGSCGGEGGGAASGVDVVKVVVVNGAVDGGSGGWWRWCGDVGWMPTAEVGGRNGWPENVTGALRNVAAEIVKIL
ncbi:hypothetical protein Tco_0989409 [Tanacetum coccineum]|uniref:Uncharacterized protein n=1 Tax=Tanacetum coccineum TaxID=301880 RepID=A0ABQ5ETP0_9ASTR